MSPDVGDEYVYSTILNIHIRPRQHDETCVDALCVRLVQ